MFASMTAPIKSETLKGIFLVNIATLSWSTNVILGRYVRAEIGPLTLTAARSLTAALVFALLMGRLPAAERRPGKDWPLLAAMALTGIIVFAPLLYFGLKFTTAVNGTLINGLGPLVTAVFAAWIIKEPFTGRQVAGSLLALAGVVVLISGASPAFFQTAKANPGDLIIIFAVSFWSLYSVAGRRVMRNRSPLSATALSLFMGLPVLLGAAFIETRFIPVAASPKLFLIILYLGLVPATLGFFSWNIGVKKLGAGGAMVFYNTLPLYGAVLGVLFLGETVGLPHLAGGALIIGGGLVSAVRSLGFKRSGKT
jgi:drug/metabolite transporter (DMT)-like permease